MAGWCIKNNSILELKSYFDILIDIITYLIINIFN